MFCILSTYLCKVNTFGMESRLSFHLLVALAIENLAMKVKENKGKNLLRTYCLHARRLYLRQANFVFDMFK